MSMGKTPLLELYHIDIHLQNARNIRFGKHPFHRLHLGPKHSRHKIWLVLRGLTWKHHVLYLLPVWVEGYRQEDLRLVVRHRGDVFVGPLTWKFNGRHLHNKDTNIHSIHIGS